MPENAALALGASVLRCAMSPLPAVLPGLCSVRSVVRHDTHTADPQRIGFQYCVNKDRITVY